MKNPRQLLGQTEPQAILIPHVNEPYRQKNRSKYEVLIYNSPNKRKNRYVSYNNLFY